VNKKAGVLMKKVTVAATQMSCTWNVEENIQKGEAFVRKAAKAGAQIILLQELFERVYFCEKEKPEYMQFATTVAENAAIQHFQKIAKELAVVLPISFYERANRAKYNSIAIIDADGAILGVYRKSHIPDGPGYEEKFYFNPGDTGFKVWQTKYAKIGVGICWDQWFPEGARIMSLMGAELLFYPTAIGSEPQDGGIDSRDHWQRVMQGHAGANLTPVIAANRTGKEVVDDSSITFYGSSFITDGFGAKVAEATREEETFLVHTFDLAELELNRSSWGVFRDRRPALYGPIATLDGNVEPK
jgi:N-carbamoylputrescine amidase